MRDSKKYLTLLDAVITASLLLGIFGTVTQIVGALQGQGVASDSMVEALTPTVFGLFIAIYTFFPRTYLAWKADSLPAASQQAPAPVPAAGASDNVVENLRGAGLSEKEKKFFLS